MTPSARPLAASPNSPLLGASAPNNTRRQNRPKLSPRTEALAYRVWQVANPRGWDMTAAEIADALDVSWQTINRVCQLKGWTTRIRKVAPGAEEGFGPVVIGGNGFFTESESAALAHYASLAEASE